jgi:hypothetical protein
MLMTHTRCLFVAITIMVGVSLLSAQEEAADGIAFSRSEVVSAARVAGIKPPALQFVIDPALGPQAYTFRQQAGETIRVTAGDSVGAMYGGLDIADAVSIGTLNELPMRIFRPAVVRRGIKFNIPLDLRTPTYSDISNAAQENIPEVWKADFWRSMLDEMARDRYNVLTLWSLHPFPSMVKVPEYPEVALQDVWQADIRVMDSLSASGKEVARKDLLAGHRVVKNSTIEEKIAFWRWVMRYAHNRGIEVYVFTWNVFTWGAEGKHGIVQKQDNPVTIAYTRASVREMVLTYPLLAGIGITAGENMENKTDEQGNEHWLWQTYGEGVRDALKQQKGREFRLLHRFHWTSIEPVMKEWKDYPGPFDFSYKYSVAHMYSSPAPPFIEEVLPKLPTGLRTWLTVRNDDIYSFRWGDPAYAREYIKNFPPADKMAGYYMGTDGYTWGREFLSTEPESPRQLVMQKQWYSFLLWGRLSYDPAIPDERFQRILASRFPQVSAPRLFEAYASASRIIPQITRFFWQDIDVKWFPEACISNPKRNGFYTVRHFAAGFTMPGSGILSIREWRDSVTGGKTISAVTPIDVAANLKRDAKRTEELVAELRPTIGANKELRLTLGDFTAYAYLANYYSEKILAAVDLALFDRSADAKQKNSAIEHLKIACTYWKQYAAVATTQYKPALYGRVGLVDLNALTAKAEEDLRIALDWKPNSLTADGLFR